MYKAFLIKYAEIAIKGKNRYIFEDALVQQIKYQLRHVEGTFQVVKEMGRIFVYPQGEYDYEEAVEALKRVFGIMGSARQSCWKIRDLNSLPKMWRIM